MTEVKDVLEIGRRLAQQFGAEGPFISFRRKLYRPYVRGRQDVYELVEGGTVFWLQFELLGDDNTLKEFTEAVQKSLEGALVETETHERNLDGKTVWLQEVSVRYHI